MSADGYDWGPVDERSAPRPKPRRAGAGSAVLAAAMLGLGEVLEPKQKDEPPFEIVADDPDAELLPEVADVVRRLES